jgi:hypothetical protein
LDTLGGGAIGTGVNGTSTGCGSGVGGCGMSEKVGAMYGTSWISLAVAGGGLLRSSSVAARTVSGTAKSSATTLRIIFYFLPCALAGNGIVRQRLGFVESGAERRGEWVSGKKSQWPLCYNAR